MGEEALFGVHAATHPPGPYGTQLLVEASPGAQVLGQLVLPYTDPVDPNHFASIHNNPPGNWCRHPAVVLRRFGQGKVVYVTGDLERADTHRDVFVNLLRLLAGPVSFEADAPKAVEVTAFYQADKGRFLVSLVNFQKELPNIPVSGIKVRVRLDGRAPERLLLLPTEEALSYASTGDTVEFTAPRLDTFARFALEYR